MSSACISRLTWSSSWLVCLYSYIINIKNHFAYIVIIFIVISSAEEIASLFYVIQYLSNSHCCIQYMKQNVLFTTFCCGSRLKRCFWFAEGDHFHLILVNYHLFCYDLCQDLDYFFLSLLELMLAVDYFSPTIFHTFYLKKLNLIFS